MFAADIKTKITQSQNKQSMSVVFIVGPKYTLAASHVAP